MLNVNGTVTIVKGELKGKVFEARACFAQNISKKGEMPQWVNHWVNLKLVGEAREVVTAYKQINRDAKSVKINITSGMLNSQSYTTADGTYKSYTSITVFKADIVDSKKQPQVFDKSKYQNLLNTAAGVTPPTAPEMPF